MADTPISGLDPATLPLSGTEQVALVQDGSTRRAPVSALGGAPTAYSLVTEVTAFTATVGVHDGIARYTRAGGNVTFSSEQPYTTGMTFPIRATAAISLVGAGVTLTPPAGGTLDLAAAMSVQVVMTSATAGDVVGQTVPA